MASIVLGLIVTILLVLIDTWIGWIVTKKDGEVTFRVWLVLFIGGLTAWFFHLTH